MVAEAFTRTAIEHFLKNQPSTGVFPSNKLNITHKEAMFPTILPHTSRLVDHLQNKIGAMASGGSVPSGGSFDQMDEKDMYHHLLKMSPHKFEKMREISAQMLGGVPSPMWDAMSDGKEPLEGEPEDYENIIRMPNTHAAARMLEASSTAPSGGGFFKALRHVGRKATGLYKMGRAALGFAQRNKDLLLELPGLRDYKEGISGFLDTAKEIDDAVNPFVDAAIDAAKDSATDADRQKLKNMATKSIDKAIETHLPEAKKYVDAAKDMNNTYQEIRKRPLYTAQSPVQAPLPVIA